MTTMMIMHTEEREASCPLLMGKFEDWDLPRVSNPGLFSRECSLLGLLSRGHSLVGDEFSCPATDSSA